MTNFEKWKNELTVEQAEEIFRYCECFHCPAYEACIGKRVPFPCKDGFEGWANSPVEGTNKPIEDKGKEIILRNLDEAIMSLNEAKNDIALVKKMLEEDNG